MEDTLSQQSNLNEDQRRVPVRRRNATNNVPRPRRRNQLSPRCVLIRNLPKGFVNWSDLVDKDQPIRVRRMVYCEDSRGSIMVEFASGAERNKILALDQQRRRRTRNQSEDQPPPDVRDAFEIKVRVERCTSENFVKRVLAEASSNGQSSAPLLTGVVTNSTTPTPPTSSSSPLVNRCIVIRKISKSDDEEDYEIAEAPEYDRKMMRWDDASIQSGATNNLQQQQSQRQPRPMEIRSGDLSEAVVRGEVLHSKAKMLPAMLIELESKESVERIFMADDGSKKNNGNASATTLAIPVEIHPVKSERYAHFCFTDVKPIPRSYEDLRSSGYTKGAKADNDTGNKSQITDADETIDVDESFKSTNGHSRKESGDDNKDGSGSETRNQKIKNLEKDISELRSDLGRWKSRALKAESGEHKDINNEDDVLKNDVEKQKIIDLEKEIRSLHTDLGQFKARATQPKVHNNRLDNENKDGLGTKKIEQREKDLRKEIRDLKANVGRWKARANKARDDLLQFRSNANGNNKVGVAIALSDDDSQKSLPTSDDATELGTTDEQNHQEELLEERKKREALEEQVRDLLTENSQLKALRVAKSSGEDINKTTESSQPQSAEGTNLKSSVDELLAENDRLKTRITEIDRLESELADSKAQQKQIEEAHAKLEEENSGLLRYVLELEGFRNGKAIAEEERIKELEKKHSDLTTLYRFVQAQSEKSAADLQKAVEERATAVAELQGFKSAWQTRMNMQRRLEESKGLGDGQGCIDCEIIEFYASMEESMTDDSDDDNAEPGEDNQATCCPRHSDDSEPPTTTEEAPSENR